MKKLLSSPGRGVNRDAVTNQTVESFVAEASDMPEQLQFDFDKPVSEKERTGDAVMELPRDPAARGCDVRIGTDCGLARTGGAVRLDSEQTRPAPAFRLGRGIRGQAVAGPVASAHFSSGGFATAHRDRVVRRGRHRMLRTVGEVRKEWTN